MNHMFGQDCIDMYELNRFKSCTIECESEPSLQHLQDKTLLFQERYDTTLNLGIKDKWERYCGLFHRLSGKNQCLGGRNPAMRYCTRGPSSRASALISRLRRRQLVQKHLWEWRRGRLALATHGISYACRKGYRLAAAETAW